MATYATSTVARLRALSDALLMLVAQIEATEGQKRDLPTDHPMFLDLSTEVVLLAQELLAGAREEEAAARLAGKYGPLIEYEPSDVRTIMDEWNAVRRALREAEPGTAEARRLRGAATELRREFLARVSAPPSTAATDAQQEVREPAGES